MLILKQHAVVKSIRGDHLMKYENKLTKKCSWKIGIQKNFRGNYKTTQGFMKDKKKK